jgi:phosphoribosyl 1,2-cyclic phosphate phosphodiesterase
MRFTILGTGTSHGVPRVACRCRVCRSPDPRDRRTRSAAAVSESGETWVIDTPPEFRLQCLASGIERVDGVLMTHQHADHIFGMDDLRGFTDGNDGRAVPVYASAECLAVLRRAFSYAFEPPEPGLTRPNIDLREVTGPFRAGPLDVSPVLLPHGPVTTLGYVFGSGRGRAAYFTDCSAVPDDVIQRVRGVDVLVIDALRHRPHPSHLTIGEALEISARVSASRTFLTHLCHEVRHDELERALPDGVRVAYDGLSIEIPAS